MADFSKGFEAVQGSYQQTMSGQIHVCSFNNGNDSYKIYGKDPTITDITRQCFYLTGVQMFCSTGTLFRLMDGSVGATTDRNVIVSLASSCDAGANSASWDFHDDPMVCLTAEHTSTLCISADVSCGLWSVNLQGYWGPKPL